MLRHAEKLRNTWQVRKFLVAGELLDEAVECLLALRQKAWSDAATCEPRFAWQLRQQAYMAPAAKGFVQGAEIRKPENILTESAGGKVGGGERVCPQETQKGAVDLLQLTDAAPATGGAHPGCTWRACTRHEGGNRLPDFPRRCSRAHGS